MKRTIGVATALFALASLPAHGADQIKVGFLSTMTGPSAVLGQDMTNGANLAMEKLGGKMGGVPTQLIVEDDQADPAAGVQKTQKLLEKDKVDILSGMIFGNVTAAVAGIAKKSGIVTVATVGSIPPLMGKECDRNFFSVAWSIDSNYEALGAYLNDKGVGSAVLMAPNYVAGKLVSDGFKRTYKGRILGEIFTKLDQPDYSVELADLRSKKPAALVVFYPGGMGIQFLKQYKAAGLMEQIPLFSSVFIADESMFPALGDIPLGIVTTSNWSPEIDNPANRDFVDSYVKKHGKRPTSMAAMGYDTIRLIAAATASVGGHVEDKDKFREAVRKADFQSVRGPFSFNTNHFPIQNYYLNEVARDPQGKLYNKLLGIAQKDVHDVFAGQCQMN